jgi:hypothetical protein
MATCEKNTRKCAVCKLWNAVRILNECGDVEIGVAMSQISEALDILSRAVVPVDWDKMTCTKVGRYALCLICPHEAECRMAAMADAGLDPDGNEDRAIDWFASDDCFGLHPPEGIFVQACLKCARRDLCKEMTMTRAK